MHGGLHGWTSEEVQKMAQLQIFIQCQGKREIRVLDFPPDATVRELVEAARGANGVMKTENGGAKSADHTVAVFTEHSDKPLPLDATLEAAGLGNKSSVHLSDCSRVTVTVHYNGKDRTEMF